MRPVPFLQLVALAMLALVGRASLAGAQDIERIRLGISYTAGARPGVLVMAGPGLDSIRRIVERDLAFSDRYEMAFLPDSLGRLADAGPDLAVGARTDRRRVVAPGSPPRTALGFTWAAGTAGERE